MRAPGFAWLGVGVLFVGGFLAATAFLAAEVDRVTREREITVVSKGVQGLKHEQHALILPQVMWDEAVVHLDNRFDAAWARDNIGAYLHNTGLFEATMLLNTQDQPIFAMRAGAEPDLAIVADFAPHFSGLLAQVRAAEAARPPFPARPNGRDMISQPIQVSELHLVDGSPYILTASLVQPDFGAALPRGPQAPILITAQAFDGDFIALLAARFQISDLHLVTASEPPRSGSGRLTLPDPDGEIAGVLEWTPQTPGMTLLGKAAPLLLLLLLLVGGVIVLLARRAHRLTDAVLSGVVRETQVRAADKAKTAFLAGMSHELRTPLNAIIGYSEMLRESAAEAGREADATDHDRILRASHHLLHLINGVLDLSKIEANAMDIVPQSTDLTQFLDETIDLIRPMAQMNQVMLKLAYRRNLGEIFIDTGKLRQCLLNLGSNACKFAKGGEVIIRADLLEAKDGRRLRLCVEDNGMGMSFAQMERIFRPFAQADGEIYAKYGGTGLGLPITREMARLMGGDVTVRSAPGRGATFILELPAPMVADAKAAEVA